MFKIRDMTKGVESTYNEIKNLADKIKEVSQNG